MSFAEFLQTKRIDEDKFQQFEPDRYRQWQQLFAQVHPDSFVLQKKFLINEVRRKYLLGKES